MTVQASAERFTAPDLSFEQPLWDAGCLFIAGIDEAGRGALAGPVTAAALVLPANPVVQGVLWGVRDSKQLTPSQRMVWAEVIRSQAVAFALGSASAQEIDRLGIAPAVRLAALRAVQGLGLVPGHLLVDFLRLPEIDLPQTPIVKGDQRSLSIAAASILAKTARDALMRTLDSQYPGYGLASHKGYGTLAHCQALQRLGPSPIHRLTFAPVCAASQSQLREGLK
jgi:ribonuclease HII